MNTRLIVSSDGSNTLFSSKFNEAYHNTKDGALSESLHKHVIPTLNLFKGRKKLRILDICFGIGYNTLSTIYYILKNDLDITVEIVSPEMDQELVRSLKEFEYPYQFKPLARIIKRLSDDLHYRDERFDLAIHIGDARKIITKMSKRADKKFDIIYQDPFSPKRNPALWTKEWFEELSLLTHSQSVLSTYSVAMTTRLGLFENGFGLYYYKTDGMRRSMLASKRALSGIGIEPVDMEHKISCNPDAKSLKDEDL